MAQQYQWSHHLQVNVLDDKSKTSEVFSHQTQTILDIVYGYMFDIYSVLEILTWVLNRLSLLTLVGDKIKLLI